MWLRKLIIYLIAIGLCGAGLGFFAGQASLGYRTGDAEAIFAGSFRGRIAGVCGHCPDRSGTPQTIAIG